MSDMIFVRAFFAILEMEKKFFEEALPWVMCLSFYIASGFNTKSNRDAYMKCKFAYIIWK